MRLTCLNFTEKTGPTRLTNPEEVFDRSEVQISSKSSGTHPAKIYYNNKPEYSNTQQGLPDYWYILSRLLIMQAFWLWSCFAEKLLIVDPYFQYFSSSLLYKYRLDLPEHLEHAWLITLSFQSTTAIPHILNFPFPIPSFTMM